MVRFAFSLLIVALFYYPVRLLKDNWVRLSLPPWCVYLAGILSWGVVISLAGPAIAIISVCANVVTSLSIGAAFEAAGVVFLIGIVANVVVVHREILDWDHTAPFIRWSMMFRNYFDEQEDLFEQLEKKKIRDIHREITGTELVEQEVPKKEMTHMDPEVARRLIEENRRKPIQSAHLGEEIRRLTAGETVDITDTFTINVLKRPTHALYKSCHELRIDASSRILSFSVHCAQMTEKTELTRIVTIQIHQDIYDALQVLLDERWIQPYKEFFEKISVTCFRVRFDSFDLPHQHAFMRVEVPVAELRLRDGQFFNIADLSTIATITMLE